MVKLKVTVQTPFGPVSLEPKGLDSIGRHTGQIWILKGQPLTVNRVKVTGPLYVLQLSDGQGWVVTGSYFYRSDSWDAKRERWTELSRNAKLKAESAMLDAWVEYVKAHPEFLLRGEIERLRVQEVQLSIEVTSAQEALFGLETELAEVRLDARKCKARLNRRVKA